MEILLRRAIRQLSVCTRLLAAALLALVARLLIAGPTPVSALTAVIVAVLFFASLLLAHHVRGIHPPSPPTARQRRR